MIPDLNILGRTFSAYTFFALAGALAAVFFIYFLAPKIGRDEFISLNMILFAFIGVVLGGHILYGLTNMELIIELIQNPQRIDSFSSFIQWITAIFGGSVFYGGLIGAILCTLLYLKHIKADIKLYVDLAVLAIPLFHFFGRLGCFFSGCCYGVACRFGVVYHYSQAPGANGLTRFPVQLVEAGLNLLLFVLLFMLLKTGRLKGKLLCVYLLIYSTARFLLEFVRGDEIRGHIGVFSTSQLISIVLFSVTVIYLITDKLRSGKKEQFPDTKKSV